MVSENPAGADNQQERSGFEQWVVGFVDGEGCFSVPIFRNRTCRLGWQVQPEFTVVQGARSVHVLRNLERFFGAAMLVVTDGMTTIGRICTGSTSGLEPIWLVESSPSSRRTR